MTQQRKPLYTYVAPAHWPVWFGLGLLRLICLLPHRAALAIGSGIGLFAHTFVAKRRFIVRRNIQLCFPEWDSDEHDRVTRDHFKAMGMSIVEMGLAWWASDRHHRKLSRIEGTEHLQALIDKGQGAILLTAHFTTVEISGTMIGLECGELDAVYRKNRSEFITELLRSGRERTASRTIEKRDIKSMVRSLKSGRPVWYAPDQSYDRKGSEVIEFFGIPSMHTTATSTLARLGKAAVLPFFPMREKDGSYVFKILPPLENFPSDDPAEDTRRYVRLLEDHVRKCPEQYFWVHRKFKNLPEGYPDYYAERDTPK